LQVFVNQHGCLPCPANAGDDDSAATAGKAQATGNQVSGSTYCSADTVACDTTLGVVPWADLGLSEDDITDGWSDRIGYAIGGTPCDGGAHQLNNLHGMQYCTRTSATADGLYVLDFDATNYLTDANTVTTAAYVLVSNGQDRVHAVAARS